MFRGSGKRIAADRRQKRLNDRNRAGGCHIGFDGITRKKFEAV
ncbi:hypothetical protein l11_11280 [Neisseria weaveri LMG 5135]|nr:hypothetical protein l13_19160 [Neisseria weaveri ATCC 51223]EGV37375.1 hypothetical protein l11_11280 [Neisseria weaveri LMG 5135]